MGAKNSSRKQHRRAGITAGDSAVAVCHEDPSPLVAVWGRAWCSHAVGSPQWGSAGCCEAPSWLVPGSSAGCGQVHPVMSTQLWVQRYWDMSRLRAPLAFIVTGTWNNHWGSFFPLFLVLAPF